MSKVSIIIPARNEGQKLHNTLKSLYDNATGDFEVIVGFNGKPWLSIPSYPNLNFLYEDKNIGLKPMINKLAKMAMGKYIYKSDAHCAFGKGFDEILQADMEEDWVVTPRFKIIKDDWSIQQRDGREEFYDYFYLSCPFTDPKGLRFKAGGHWREKTDEKLDILIDETPQMHGSGWFVNRKYFLNTLEGFPEDDWDGHAQEPIWLGLRNWIRGGKLMVNKKTWYAHLHQNSKNRGYPEDRSHTEKTYNETASFWLKAKWYWSTNEPKLRDIEWFVDKFMPMPTWPDNWKELLTKWREENG